MASLSFTVPGDPIGKERPRKGKYGNFYTPQKTKDFEEKVWFYFLLKPKVKYTAAYLRCIDKLKIDALFFFKNLRHPDLDNCWKAIADGLQGPGRLGNDKRFKGSMDWFQDKKNPRTEITISWEV